MAQVGQVAISSDIPEALRPFYVGAEGKAGLIERGIGEIFTPYGDRYGELARQGYLGAGEVAGLSPFQEQVGQRLAGMQMPGQFGLATQAGQQAGAGLQSLLGTQAMGVYAPELSMYQMGPAQQVGAQQVGTRDIQAAQTGYSPELQYFQMNMPGTFGQEQFQQYANPYMQNVVDIQQRQAIDAARKAQLGQNLGAARQGTYGGARQTILQGQRESGLRQQLGDIQATGLQNAFQQAQQQFERDRAAQMGAAGQNLQAALGVQQLGTQTNLQTALSNLNAEQQARVQSEANRLQAQGMNQQSALQAALANQQAGLTVGQQNLSAALGVQQLGAGQSLEAQRANQAAALQAAQQRFGAAQGLGQLAQTFGGLGTQQLAGELDITKTQGAFGDLQRAIAQQQRDAQRQALMDEANYGMTQVGQLSNLLRGIPLSDTTQRTTTPPPSFASQLTGMGLTGLGLYNMMQGGRQ
jgi:hypothetical protein